MGSAGRGAGAAAPLRVHILGGKNHGKTELVTALAAEFTRRGLRVGTVKHTSHEHELDTPGKDSHRHRAAGGRPAAVITSGLVALFVERRGGEDPYALLAPLYRDCDLVLVEGDLEAAGGLKLEVWRAALGTAPLACSRPGVAAVITDDPLEAPVEVWPRSDVAALADRVWARLSG